MDCFVTYAPRSDEFSHICQCDSFAPSYQVLSQQSLHMQQ
jgi:hypothetical protein